MLIQKHNLNWKTDFNKISSILKDTLDGLILSIEHVGSTAVPDLDAKPIIDIDVIFEGDVFSEIKERLIAIGYYHNGDQGIPDREVFKRDNAANHPILDSISHHLYVCSSDSEELKNHLLFRDHLKSNESARNQYIKIKLDLAEKANQDKKVYANLKEIEASAFIRECIKTESNR
jgi:GrpB-like predicted nucleotidyltransferase (UPF0157 family)